METRKGLALSMADQDMDSKAPKRTTTTTKGRPMNGKLLVVCIAAFFVLFFFYESWLMRGLSHGIMRRFILHHFLISVAAGFLLAAPDAKSQPQGKCLKVADYKGCMEYHSDVNSSSREVKSGAEPSTVDVSQPNPYNYNPAPVMQLKILGSYGRYITFIGKTVNEYAGTSGYSTPGSPATVNCYTTGGYGGISGYTTCQRTGYVAPSCVPGTHGGVQNRSYRYELDCQHMTFDRKGDYAGGIPNKGWMNIDSDPTAQAVANKYGSIIDDLPKRPDLKAYSPIELDWDNWKAEGDKYVAKAMNSKEELLYLAVSCEKRLINTTGSDGNWKAWNSSSLKFERALINDLYQVSR